MQTLADSAAVSTPDSTSVSSAELQQIGLKAQKKARAEALRKEKIEKRAAVRAAREKAREERWAELDRKDAEKLQKKLDRKAAKLRERKRKALEDARKQTLKDAQVLERYVNRLRAREDRKAAKELKKRRSGFKLPKASVKSLTPAEKGDDVENDL